MTRINESILSLYARMHALRNREEGASMAEYGLLVALIAAVAIAATTALGEGVRDKFQEVADAI